MTTHTQDPATTTTGVAMMRYPNDPAIRERVLSPYRSHAKYLRSAEVRTEGEVVTAMCRLAVEESWYIDSTGHFNSVEFNICYNQVAYYLIAMTVQEHLIGVFDGWTMDDYWARQLPNVVISELRSRFRAPIDPLSFYGELAFTKTRFRARRADKAPLVIIETTCRFWDDNGGLSDGEVRLALTNPPEAATG